MNGKISGPYYSNECTYIEEPNEYYTVLEFKI